MAGRGGKGGGFPRLAIAGTKVCWLFCSGRFLTSAAFDCAASQAECGKLGTFLNGLPQDVIVLLAVQDSAVDSGKTLPTSELTAVGAQQAGSVAKQTAHAVIGYKGQNNMPWKVEKFTVKGSGPAKVSSSIPISCSYVPEGNAKSFTSRLCRFMLRP